MDFADSCICKFVGAPKKPSPCAVRLGLRRFREWLEREGEAANLLRRARARRGIVEAIARGRAAT